MIIGNTSEKNMVRFNIEIHCTNCGNKVPGGIKTGKKHSQTRTFKKELEDFKKNYLCGICRDKNRVKR